MWVLFGMGFVGLAFSSVLLFGFCIFYFFDLVLIFIHCFCCPSHHIQFQSDPPCQGETSIFKIGVPGFSHLV